jgi:hypothetical protein
MSIGAQFTPFSSINPLRGCSGRDRQQRSHEQRDLKNLSFHFDPS